METFWWFARLILMVALSAATLFGGILVMLVLINGADYGPLLTWSSLLGTPTILTAAWAGMALLLFPSAWRSVLWWIARIVAGGVLAGATLFVPVEFLIGLANGARLLNGGWWVLLAGPTVLVLIWMGAVFLVFRPAARWFRAREEEDVARITAGLRDTGTSRQ
ncbi:hypothetical protein ORV05_08560 [Amycolatopsis cynarae]|uniref:DUF4175 domain-containing protein n=1 Tax=Amycolatopsis cynarae TaxID=2995223 RepID=A0ABY7B6M9_9PSEU|nr:hypothetical protein [Amycolatopsis sp. HUAS 11-8]WAL67806.1 hypothetical protein ORV05_08560 [Amycolatopsis sp. HUAS 11-8]